MLASNVSEGVKSRAGGTDPSSQTYHMGSRFLSFFITLGSTVDRPCVRDLVLFRKMNSVQSKLLKEGIAVHSIKKDKAARMIIHAKHAREFGLHNTIEYMTV